MSILKKKLSKQQRMVYARLLGFFLMTDQAFDIHDRQILQLLSKRRKAQEELQKQNGKSINEKVVLFADLAAALIKARSEGIDPFVALDAIHQRGEAARTAHRLRLFRLAGKEILFAAKVYTCTVEITGVSFHQLSRATYQSHRYYPGYERNQEAKIPEGAPLNFVSNRWR